MENEKEMNNTVWVGVAGDGTPVFATRSKSSASDLASNGWAGRTITITKIEVER